MFVPTTFALLRTRHSRNSDKHVGDSSGELGSGVFAAKSRSFMSSESESESDSESVRHSTTFGAGKQSAQSAQQAAVESDQFAMNIVIVTSIDTT